jgi:hypothetical protein
MIEMGVCRLRTVLMERENFVKEWSASGRDVFFFFSEIAA